MRKYVPAILACIVAFAFISASTAQAPTKEVVLKINSINAKVDDKDVKLPTAPIISNGTTLLPIRFIVDELLPDCADIDWNGATREVTISNIPVNPLSCSYIEGLESENNSLTQRVAELEEEIERLRRETDPIDEEDTIPPIIYSKNGIVFELKSIKRERKVIVDKPNEYYLRLDVKVTNKTEDSCRFPASNTKLIIGNERYSPVDYDVPAFINSIPGGSQKSGWIRFRDVSGESTSPYVTFEFIMWPKDAINHFDFHMKVNLDEAIPNEVPLLVK